MTISAGTAVSEVRSAPITERRFLVPFVLITSLFFLWAFGVNLNDILIPHLKNVFGLSDFQSSFIQVAFFGGYFLAAFPAGWAMEKIGYKKGILAGLFLCAVGAILFLPASSSRASNRWSGQVSRSPGPRTTLPDRTRAFDGYRRSGQNPAQRDRPANNSK